jgi:SAM-dependent methyltransferase
MTTDTWSAQTYNTNAHFVYSDKFTAPVFALLDPKPGEKILDLGCGSGELTVKLAEIVGQGGVVVGTDYSESMVRAYLHTADQTTEPWPFVIGSDRAIEEEWSRELLCRRRPSPRVPPFIHWGPR